jgi:hypothetical protein
LEWLGEKVFNATEIFILSSFKQKKVKYFVCLPALAVVNAASVDVS